MWYTHFFLKILSNYCSFKIIYFYFFSKNCYKSIQIKGNASHCYWSERDNCNIHLTGNVGVLSASQLLYCNAWHFNIAHYYFIASLTIACFSFQQKNYTLCYNFFSSLLQSSFLLDSTMKLYQVVFFLSLHCFRVTTYI